MTWDQRHTLNGSLIYQIQRWTVSLIGRYWTGRPYTPSFVKGEYVDSGREQFGAIFGSHVTLQPHVVTYPGVKVAPNTVISPGTVVKEDMM